MGFKNTLKVNHTQIPNLKALKLLTKKYWPACTWVLGPVGKWLATCGITYFEPVQLTDK